MPSFSSLPRALLVRSVCLSAHSGLSVPSRTYLIDTSLMSSRPPASRATLHSQAAARIGRVSLLSARPHPSPAGEAGLTIASPPQPQPNEALHAPSRFAALGRFSEVAPRLPRAARRSPRPPSALLVQGHALGDGLPQTVRRQVHPSACNQTAMANGRGKIEERLARWLDRVDGNEL